MERRSRHLQEHSQQSLWGAPGRSPGGGWLFSRGDLSVCASLSHTKIDTHTHEHVQTHRETTPQIQIHRIKQTHKVINTPKPKTQKQTLTTLDPETHPSTRAPRHTEDSATSPRASKCGNTLHTNSQRKPKAQKPRLGDTPGQGWQLSRLERARGGHEAGRYKQEGVSCSGHAGEAWTGPSRTPWWPLSCLSP